VPRASAPAGSMWRLQQRRIAPVDQLLPAAGQTGASAGSGVVRTRVRSASAGQRVIAAIVLQLQSDVRPNAPIGSCPMPVRMRLQQATADACEASAPDYRSLFEHTAVVQLSHRARPAPGPSAARPDNKELMALPSGFQVERLP